MIQNLAIQSLRKELEKEITRREKSVNFYDRLVRRIFSAKIERLDFIERILSYPRHNVAVIGTVGAGKTTAICHLFNLTNEVPTKSGITEIQELLRTGPGYTTICEVVLLEGEDRTRIEVEPYTREELESLIVDFCYFIHEKVNPDSDDKSHVGKKLISREIERALKNIVNLNTVTREVVDDTGKKVKKRIDEAKEEYTRFQGNFEEFKESVLERAALDNRTTTVIEYDYIINNEKQWLKETFENLNEGKRKDCSIPKKISVYIGKSILQGSEFSHFSSIIDTKGLDTNENRRDLDEYIKSEDTICVFTTEYQDAPDTNIRKLLEYYFADKSAYYQTKIMILVLARKGQPESEQGADGDRETGLDIRKEIIQTILQGLGINELSDDNIAFYDAFNHYDNNKDVSNADKDLISRDKEEIIELLNKVIQNRRIFFEEEFNNIQRDFEQIINGNGLTEVEEQLIDQMYENISEYKKLNFHNYNQFVDLFLDDYKIRYAAATMKAIHRRHGIYTGIRDNNMYYDAQRVAEGVVRSVVLNYYKEINYLFEKLRQKLDNLDLIALIEETSYQFIQLYNRFLRKVSEEIYSFLIDQKLSNSLKSDFWWDVINTRGSGYKNNVTAIFRDELEGTNDGLESANHKLRVLTEKYWERDVIIEISNFFKRKLVV